MIKDSKDYSDRYKSMYSTLFGLGVGVFITHAFKYWKQISGPNGIQLTELNTLFILIQLYLLFNYFRYLFGLRRFAEMTGQNFMPCENDWIDKSKNSLKIFFVNIFKILVTNVGIFQLLVFSIISLLIIPELENNGNRDAFKSFYEDHIFIMQWFFKLDFLLLSSDLLAVVLYNRLSPEMIQYRKEKNNSSDSIKSDTTNKEMQMNIWILANGIEMFICIGAIYLLSMGTHSNVYFCTILMSVKFLLLVAEIAGVYYFLKRFNPLKWIGDFINGTT